MRRRTTALLLALATTACGRQPVAPEPTPFPSGPGLAWAPGWSRDAVCYELFVRSFRDSDGDGIGDLDGVRERLDHINDGDPRSRDDLGATCIWLMPVAQSPSYHGYDVADYYRIDPEYGTRDDFRELVAEAHRRGIRVIVDLVLNHVSSQHPAFQSALTDPGSPYREWFRWLPRHPGVRNPWGGDNWHRSPLRDEWYYGFFWSGMPDLNHESAAVRAETKRIADFWLHDMGADGFRLDAVSFLVEDGHDRVQHTAGTHAVLRDFAAHVRRTAPKAFTIGEVWDRTDALASYYPDQLDAYFAFEVSDSLLAAVNAGAARPLMQAVARAMAAMPDQRWAPFLRNHDQERTLTALGGDIGRARAAATLLLTLPGVPFVYYGEEIGMAGGKDGVPEADMGVRTPMQWSAAPNAGFTTGSPWYAPRPDWRTVNVDAQRADSGSLLRHYSRLIHLRTATPALASGEWLALETAHPAVAAYARRRDRQVVLVLVNLGAEPAAGVAVSSAASLLPAGSHQPRALFGGATPAELTVASHGRLEAYAPMATLEPHAGYVIELAR